MELWIRSQDKLKLVKCNDIAIATDTEDGKTIRGYKIVGYFDKQTEYEELGFYTLHSRALEVLDEIEHILDPSYKSRGKMCIVFGKETKLVQLQTYVYNMPKK